MRDRKRRWWAEQQARTNHFRDYIGTDRRHSVGPNLISMSAAVYPSAAETHLRDQVTKRNKQIRAMRLKMKDLLDFLGDARLAPPLPKDLQHWLRKEVERV